MEEIKNTKVTKVTEISATCDHEYDGDIEASCPHCGSEDVYGMSRVVGYFSVIDNWNKSKKSELKRRQKGNYWQ